MKRNFMKKAVAVSLSAAMAFSLSAATALTASAATTVSMPKTAKVTVGKNKTLKVTTNKKWKVTKVGVNQSKKYVTVKRISNTKVRVTGKKATSKAVTVRVRVKKKTGNKAEKVLKCKVTVKKASTPDVTPTPTPTPEVKTSADVANQAELDAALKDSNIKTINIKTTDKVDFVIPEGTHDVDLTVNAAAASVTNSAKFKSITIEAIAPNTWTEKGKNNTITVKGKSVHFVFDPAAIIDRILVTIQSAVTIDGKASNTVPVEVAATAEGSSVASQAPVAIKASAEVSITLEASAAGSTVEVVRGQKPFDVNLTNKTPNDITVKDEKGTTVVTAPKNSTTPVKGTTQVADPTTPTPTPTPQPGTTPTKKTDLANAYLDFSSAKPTVETKAGEVSGSSIKNASVTVTFGDAKVCKQTPATTSGGSLGYSEISDASVGYLVTVKETDKNGATVGAKTVDESSNVSFDLLVDDDENKVYYLSISAYIKGNDTYNQGKNVPIYEATVTVKNDGKIEGTVSFNPISGVVTEGSSGKEYVSVGSSSAH